MNFFKRAVKVTDDWRKIAYKNLYSTIQVMLVAAPLYFIEVYGYFYFQHYMLKNEIVRLAGMYMIMLTVVPAAYIFMVGFSEYDFLKSWRFLKYAIGLLLLLANLFLTDSTSIGFIATILLVDAYFISSLFVLSLHSVSHTIKKWVEESNYKTITSELTAWIVIISSILSTLLVAKNLFK